MRFGRCPRLRISLNRKRPPALSWRNGAGGLAEGVSAADADGCADANTANGRRC
jgi:hypothetical protein